MKVQKSFNTILKNNPQVEQKSKKLSSSLRKKLTKKLPVEFNPIQAWGPFLSPVRNQGDCGNCYAQACVGALTNRYNLLTLGQFLQTLSASQVTICDGALSKSVTPSNTAEINMKAHSSIGCTGNTIYNVVEFLYMYGAVTQNCFDNTQLEKERGVNWKNMKDPYKLPYCSDMLGVDFDKCLDGKTPARFFRVISQNNVGKDPEEIKHAIYHWGPVVTGMMIYSNFLDDYDGTTIYMGPKDTDTLQGGHAIQVLGWGEENGVKYWWCCNSWGADWGLLGYFKIMINCPKSEIENNVVEFLPDIPTINELGEKYFDYEPLINEEDALQRNWFGVDPVTGYKFSTLREFKKRGIEVKPLFQVDRLPDYSTFWAGEISSHPFGIRQLQLTGDIDVYVLSEYTIVFSLILIPIAILLVIKFLHSRK